MKIKIYYTFRPVPKSNRKIAKRIKIDTPITQIHNRGLSWLVYGHRQSQTSLSVCHYIIMLLRIKTSHYKFCFFKPFLMYIIYCLHYVASKNIRITSMIERNCRNIILTNVVYWINYTYCCISVDIFAARKIIWIVH